MMLISASPKQAGCLPKRKLKKRSLLLLEGSGQISRLELLAYQMWGEFQNNCFFNLFNFLDIITLGVEPATYLLFICSFPGMFL